MGLSADELGRRRNLGFKGLVPAKQIRGWPQQRECLGCGRVRRSEGPGDRLCQTCRARISANDTGPPHRLLPW